MAKLNLGCGEDKKAGYINVDFHSHVKPDIVHDLNTLPYPFEDSTFELVEVFHVLEHLDKPFDIMKELHRILKPEGVLHIKVPHFSRGFTHAEHKSGFDLMFPYYFDRNFTNSGYYGVDFKHIKTELHWMAHPELLKFVGIGHFTMTALKVVSQTLNFFARLDPRICSRIWCFWVGGFEEIEFKFICKK